MNRRRRGSGVGRRGAKGGVKRRKWCVVVRNGAWVARCPEHIGTQQ